MNKNELIRATAEKCGMTQQDVWKVMDVLPGIIQKELAAGNKVQLIGFGTFSVVKRPARMGRNPRTGKQIKIAAISARSASADSKDRVSFSILKCS